MRFRLFSTAITSAVLLANVLPASATILSLPSELSSQLSERQSLEVEITEGEMLISGRARRQWRKERRARRRANRQQRRQDRFESRMCRRFGDCR